MHYLIDGHNLIAKIPDISLDDPSDEAKLVLRLRSWAAAGRKRRVTVIFDSGLPGGEAHRLSTGPVKVLFASAGRTADALLIGRIQKANNPMAYTLVTSDRAVLAAAKVRRMPHVKAEEFAKQIRQRDVKNDAISEAVEPNLSEGEIDEWLTIFGNEVDD